MTELLVQAEQRGRVVLITLNRPKQLNALNDALMDQLGAALDQRIGTKRLGGKNTARHGEDIAVLFGGQAGGDERTAFFIGLDDEHAPR